MMKESFEITATDRRVYEEYLREWLPRRMIDIHTHIWLEKLSPALSREEQRVVSWPSMVARENSVEDHLECYELMFPGKRVTPMVFANLPDRRSIDAMNRYVSDSAREHGLPALLFALPEWSADELERRVTEGGFLGIKVYLSLAPSYIPAAEIRIFDFLPPHQLQVIDRHGWIVMLHIPRDLRLRDPVNLAQMVQIERDYPNLQMVIAHVGRAYCKEDVGNAMEVLGKTERMMFDFSANTNDWVFAHLLRAVGPERVLFGSDLPILRMRMRRICRNGRYVNLVPAGLYGDVSADPHMEEVSGREAEELTLFMYEELLAFRRASESVGLSVGDRERVFYDNARRLLKTAGWSGGSNSEPSGAVLQASQASQTSQAPQASQQTPNDSKQGGNP